jgi:hypothetical protein
MTFVKVFLPIGAKSPRFWTVLSPLYTFRIPRDSIHVKLCSRFSPIAVLGRGTRVFHVKPPKEGIRDRTGQNNRNTEGTRAVLNVAGDRD